MDYRKGLVSVVIPVFNARSYIEESLRSALSQTYKQIEIVVVNDGSTDGSEAVIQRYAGKKIKYFSRTHEGIAGTRNFGMRHSEGEFIAFLDADDVWKPEKIGKQLEKLGTERDAGMVYCPVEVMDADGKPVEGIKQPAELKKGWIFEDLLLNNFITTSSVLIRRGVIAAVGDFDRSLKIIEDYDYFLRASRVARVACVREPLVSYRLSATSITSAKDRVRIKDLILCRRYAKKYLPERPDLMKTKEHIILKDIGLYYFQRMRLKRARTCFYGAWKLNKSDCSSLIYWLASMLPPSWIVMLKRAKSILLGGRAR